MVDASMPAASQDPPSFAEFDHFATHYSAGMENPVKRLVGRSADDFILPKARWLMRNEELLRSRRGRPSGESGCRADSGATKRVRTVCKTVPLDPSSTAALLDLGCGSGRLLAQLRRLGFPRRLYGCDVSGGMLAELARTWNSGDLPELRRCEDETRIPFGTGVFASVVASAVIHHVVPGLRQALYAEMFRVTAGGGTVYVFEHNPYHPITRWVVSHTAMDRNARLAAPSEVRAGLYAAGFRELRTRYLLFLPPRWHWTSWADRYLGWFPAGGQYVVTGRRTD